ncbi:TIGR03862 family flavoprotein [Piscinibacter sp.]|uniref:TIGR03862 family flavoprotein n=1 Tax=Piscinibacter sp. TaxID=1903157 RepID=UPI0039E2D332
MQGVLPAVVVGGGPAGLMAAEALAAAGVPVHLFDAMPSVGRKFLLAGKGGLNLTHSEPAEPFVARYGAAGTRVARWLAAFGPQDLRDWARGLGIATFVGSSGRVFPVDMKAAPLLRAWLQRLRANGVRLHMRHRWIGWGESEDCAHALRFATPDGETTLHARTVVLALGGASWARLGSDGAWVPRLAERGVGVAPLQASNCGFDVARWSEHLRTRFAGAPLKNVALRCGAFHQRGEFVLTEGGIEGSLVYAASATLREAIAAQGRAVAEIDLLPERGAEFVHAEVARPRGARSMSTHLKSRLGLDGAKAALLRELLPRQTFADAAALAAAIKALPVTLLRARPIDEAISSAGGVRLDELDENGMLKRLPGVFCAGEMLDWEAPTGGYLLTASFASGLIAGRGAVAHCAAFRDAPSRA